MLITFTLILPAVKAGRSSTQRNFLPERGIVRRVTRKVCQPKVGATWADVVKRVGRNRFIAPLAPHRIRPASRARPPSLAETGRPPRRGETTRTANRVHARQVRASRD